MFSEKDGAYTMMHFQGAGIHLSRSNAAFSRDS
jgi:hypothetical protein